MADKIRYWKRVGVFVPTYSGYYHGLLRGIREYAAEGRNWKMVFAAEPIDALATLRQTTFDGVLLEAGGDYANILKHYHGPTVLVSNNPFFPQLHRGAVDDKAVGRLAAEHLMGNGHVHFGFVGIRGMTYAQERLAGFRSIAESLGRDVHQIELPGDFQAASSVTAIRSWLVSLPTPIGILTCNDALGIRLTRECSLAGRAVPQDIAVVGVDNIGLECELNDPPLSSVIVPMERIGYGLAGMLDRLMAGEEIQQKLLLFPPGGVVVRESSDGSAIDDPHIRGAIEHIREHAGAEISVDDVAESVGVCRRTLERRFKKLVGRGVLSEIHRTRIERAKELLVQTRLRIPVVSQRCGFDYVSHFCSTFKRITGETPGAFRRRFCSSSEIER